MKAGKARLPGEVRARVHKIIMIIQHHILKIKIIANKKINKLIILLLKI